MAAVVIIRSWDMNIVNGLGMTFLPKRGQRHGFVHVPSCRSHRNGAKVSKYINNGLQPEHMFWPHIVGTREC